MSEDSDSHARERERLAMLRSLSLMDTPADPVFDAITRLAATICGTPIALISLVDDKRQWFKSAVGLAAKQTPREHAFCAHAIQNASMMQIQDAAQDIRFADNPLVTGDPNIRFYAGQPISVGGHRLGTLCVIDTQPRTLTLSQQRALIDLGLVTQTLITQRSLVAKLPLNASALSPGLGAAPKQPAAGKKPKVLYVEDNRLNALLLEQLCATSETIQLVVCTSIDEMYRELQLGAPSFILLDINLPGASGLEILSWLKRTPATKSIRVVMVSAEASEETVATAKSLGAEDFWTKPLNLANVQKVLDSIE